MNFQVSILKVLASYPNGLASLSDIKRDLAFLATSGSDWAKYSKRLGATFPSLDVFSLGFVQRYSFGWRLAAKGAIALEMMEESARATMAFIESTPDAPALETVPVERCLSDVEPVGERTQQPTSPADRRALFTVVEGGRSKAA
ncbi:hypothetical protein IVB33_17235 [Bradyrhizobium sp. 24]|uniref:hypothetical protein n=1 Tax=unclassified Bradyrhizobium TaxID=2631580 RepID=UPI001FF93E5A|nr:MULTISPECIES: hypothetical protein [unclassified Bradyrhizobium]MCK1303798.1 hypothetical protein [Bradyrhizobium sp. 37]MCK1379361.1 hypothetical protein [Bradyrhizobium sp. 24]MCK1770316.1 hypothetical protein [Bradyrhizobium sp. 134]